MKYTLQEQETIKKIKEYLKAIRTLKRERFHLLEEYQEFPSPQSPSFEEKQGTPLSQITRLNDYTLRRDLLLKKIELFNKHIDNFTLKTILLPTRQRQIIHIYMESLSYMEMVDRLEDDCHISLSTYKREWPMICLTLSQYIDDLEIPTLEQLDLEMKKEYKKIENL